MGSGEAISTRGRLRRAVLNPQIAAGVLGAVLVASVVFAVTFGPADITPGEVWASVLHHLGFGTSPLTELRDGIVWALRMPRVLTAAAVGAGLAVSGAVMQALTRNPLADPYLLGLSSGASLGAVLVPMILGGGKTMMMGNLIQMQFGPARNWPLGAAISIVLMSAVLVFLLWRGLRAVRQENRELLA